MNIGSDKKREREVSEVQQKVISDLQMGKQSICPRGIHT